MPNDLKVNTQRLPEAGMSREVTAAANAAADDKAKAPESSQASQQAQQSQQNQDAQRAQDAQAAQVKQVAEQAKAAQVQQEKNYSLSMEFMNTFQALYQEGYEAYRVPQTDQGAGVFGDSRGQEMQRDQQIIREFIREAQRLLSSDKNMEVAQMVLRIKAEQGGVFWQKVEQALQRGMSPQHGEIKSKFGAPETPVAGEKGTEAGKLLQNQAGRAMLELLKAEANPNAKLESMVLILQALQREGLKDSSQKLLSYMKNRYDLTDDELTHFLRKRQLLPFYTGPLPREERGAKSQGTLWYILISLLVVPLVVLLGLDLLWGIALGIAILGFLFITQGVKREK